MLTCHESITFEHPKVVKRVGKTSLASCHCRSCNETVKQCYCVEKLLGLRYLGLLRKDGVSFCIALMQNNANKASTIARLQMNWPQISDVQNVFRNQPSVLRFYSCLLVWSVSRRRVFHRCVFHTVTSCYLTQSDNWEAHNKMPLHSKHMKGPQDTQNNISAATDSMSIELASGCVAWPFHTLMSQWHHHTSSLT